MAEEADRLRRDIEELEGEIARCTAEMNELLQQLVFKRRLLDWKVRELEKDGTGERRRRIL